MVNPTYKHLEDKFRVGPLSLAQWAQLVISVVAGLLFAIYLSPFSVQITTSLTILLMGVPFAVSYAAMDTEFSVAELVRLGAGFYRASRRMPPGAGSADRPGYRIERDPVTSGLLDADPDPDAPVEGPLWDY